MQVHEDTRMLRPCPEMEYRYQLLVQSIKDYAIYMLTPDGYVDSWNAGAAHFKGYTAEEIIGRHFSTFYTPEDRAAGVPFRALQIAATEGKFEAEGWRVRKDGTRFWAHVVIDPVRDHSGKLIGFAKITRDQTEKKAAQDALRESEQRFRFLVKGVTDYAIYMISPEGEITNWNAGAQRIKGYSAEEVIGTHFSRFYTEEDRKRGMPARALATARTEGKFEAEGWRVRKDGTRFWAHVVLDPVYDDQGNMIGFAKITRDITEKRKAAEMLEQTRAALFQSQKMEAIGKLTGGIAHDFNNLLAGIMGHLELMRVRLSMGQTEELGRNLEAAIAVAKRSAALTHRLLAFARRQTLQPKAVEVSSLVDSMRDLLQRAVGPDIEILFELDENSARVVCDPNQLENALLNLVVNARDAMPEGGRIVIHTSEIVVGENAGNHPAELHAGQYTRLSVIDSGTGMSPEVLAQAFEPFFTTKPFGEGTGLGLSMVQGFVLQSGGHIAIDSKPGKGTSVHLYFPCSEAPAEADPPENDVLLPPACSREQRKIVVVEDEEAVRSILAEMLTSMGFNPILAQDGHEGLRLLESLPQLDLLITDIGLPGGMNGRQLAGMAQQRHRGLKVLLVTGYAEQSVVGNTQLPKGMQLLTKPFEMKTLMSKVQSLIEET